MPQVALNKTFEPLAAATPPALDELTDALASAAAAVEKLERLRQRLAREIEAASERLNALEIFTESEAAEVFQIKETHLADLRRTRQLPHINFGSKIRYSRIHLHEIAETLSRSGRVVSLAKHR